MRKTKISRRMFIQGAGVIAGSGLLASCSQAALAPSATVAAVVGDTKAGGSLIAALSGGDISGFLTWQASTSNDSGAWTAIYDTLVEYDKEYKIVGGIFTDWKSDDAISWKFTVRQGVKWHDGKPLVAQHVIDYFDTLLKADSGAGTEKVATVKGASYKATDEKTVELVLAEPNAALLSDLSSHWLARTSDFDPSKPIGTGPFSFVEWQRNQHIKVKKNASYWKENLPYLDELTLRMVPDQDQAVNLLTTNEIQVIPSVALPKVAALKENTAIQVIQVPEPYRLAFSFLLTKTDAAPWDNTKVRQALNWAVDRKAMLAATLGYGSVKSNPVAKGSWAFNPNAQSYASQDLDMAKALMAEAGFAPGKKAFKTTLKWWKEWQQNEPICQIIQANLAELGIEVELQLLEIGQWVKTVQGDVDYQMALTALVPRWDPSDQLGNAYKTDDGAALKWSNKAFDDAFAAAAATADQEQRKKAFFTCQEIAMVECPATILNEAPQFAAASAKVQGVIQHNRSFMIYHEAWLKS